MSHAAYCRMMLAVMLSGLGAGCAAPASAAPVAVSVLPSPAKHSYVERIIEAISAHSVYHGAVPAAGNPAVTVLITSLPDGGVESVDLLRTSGYPDFDAAVRQGILKASPLPRKNDGTVERRIEVRFLMKKVAPP